ncbi:hypothetical protein IWT25_01749 [Secundilactobacillus pentosiphilus]|nr:hypothetical protein [Secundilactobacillus pentosiphilus]GAX06405.1 hypothetical protein IWT25_01749 [Secundilactobacillus pentosiphilus]
MELNLIDLGGFVKQGQKVLADTDEKYISRTEFDHKLILVVNVQKQNQQVKIQSNFEWEKVGDKWRPNVDKPNENFVDPLAKK